MGSKASKTTVNLDTAARLDIICRKGDTFTLALDFGKSIADAATSSSSEWDMDVRESDTATGTVLNDTDFTYSITDGTATRSKLTITASASTMNVTSGLYVYDLQQTTTAAVKTYLYGTFTVNEDVTVVS
jgi:hypothetical protein